MGLMGSMTNSSTVQYNPSDSYDQTLIFYLITVFVLGSGWG